MKCRFDRGAHHRAKSLPLSGKYLSEENQKEGLESGGSNPLTNVAAKIESKQLHRES